MERTEQPAAICLTLSAGTIKDYPGGYRAILETFERCTGNNPMVWCYRLGFKPRHMVPICLWTIGGKVRFASTVVQYLDGQTLEFENGRTMTAKAWIQCVDFQPLPKPRRQLKGFRGFRYLTHQQLQAYGFQQQT